MVNQLRRLGGAAAISAALTVLPHAPAEAQAVPTNLPNVRAYPGPPPGFDPRTASDAALEQYGLPPRPDPTLAPRAYDAWQMFVATPMQRIIPQLKQSQIYHGPVQQPVVTGLAQTGTATATTSSNWSGRVVLDGSNPFQNLTAITMVLLVPFAQCGGSNTNTMGSAWPGIDGYTDVVSGIGSSDVLQAGIDFDCVSGVPIYYTWFEWFPDPAIPLLDLIIKPGDLIGVMVWNYGPIFGNVLVADFTTNTSASLIFPPLSGQHLTGNSIEWIVERPSFQNNISTLTNYLADITLGHDLTLTATAPFLAVYTPGSSPKGTTFDITMLDNSNNRISCSVVRDLADLLVFYYLPDFSTPPC